MGGPRGHGAPHRQRLVRRGPRVAGAGRPCPQGRHAALALHREPWADLLAEMARTFPAYVEDFLRLEAMAPPGDLPRLRLLTAHETAAIDFLDLEKSGDKDSVAPMNAYLEKGIA